MIGVLIKNIKYIFKKIALFLYKECYILIKISNKKLKEILTYTSNLNSEKHVHIKCMCVFPNKHLNRSQ